MEDYGFNLILYVIKSTVFSLGVSHLFNIVFDIAMRKYSILIALNLMMDLLKFCGPFFLINRNRAVLNWQVASVKYIFKSHDADN